MLQVMQKLNVLIVDDQAGVRLLLETIVKEAGHRVAVAKNGLEAVQLVSRVKPDLVFLDIKMPVMDGLQALERIKSISPLSKVIIMTAFNSEKTLKKAMHEGALRCILKPFDIKQIRDFIAECAGNLGKSNCMVKMENRSKIVKGA